MLGTVIIMYNLEDQLSCDSLARVDHPFCASVLSTFFDLLRSAQSLILKSFKLFGHNLGTIKPNNWTMVQNWQYSLLESFNSTSLGTKQDSLAFHTYREKLIALCQCTKLQGTFNIYLIKFAIIEADELMLGRYNNERLHFLKFHFSHKFRLYLIFSLT